MTIRTRAAASALALAALAGPAAAQDALDPSTLSTRERQVYDLLRSLETGDRSALAVIDPAAYVQHNLGAADGLAGMEAFLDALPPTTRANPVRVFEDGDYVFAHGEYDILGPKVSFDIFRFEGDRIVEHWDNLQELAGPNPSGRTMTDGPVTPTDLDQTEANKTLVRSFVQDVFIDGRMDRLPSYFDGNDYVQHNPMAADGLDGFQQAFAAMAAAGVTIKFDRIEQVLGEGDFVLVASEGTVSGTPTAFYDLYRVEDGKIAEHWDTIEAIPPRSEWRNTNGKF